MSTTSANPSVTQPGPTIRAAAYLKNFTPPAILRLMLKRIVSHPAFVLFWLTEPYGVNGATHYVPQSFVAWPEGRHIK